MTTIDLAVAKQIHAVGGTVIAHALEVEKRMIDAAVRDKVSLPEHYWQERWMLQRKHKALGKLIEALEESA